MVWGRWRLLLAILFGMGLVWGGWLWWTQRRYQRAMEEIEAEIMAGRHAIACQKLNRLMSWKADPKGGIAFLLGSCELARRRPREAGEAWARVVPGSAFSEKAIRGRMRLLDQSGQLAAAERLIQDAALDRRNDRTALLVLLVPSFNQQGRIDEAVRLIETRWEDLNKKGEGAMEPAIVLLRQHIELTSKATPVDALRAFIDTAARLAPQDDRVWLARANLAIRTGALEEAGRWLDSCLRLRPDDVQVWRTRLTWGMATDRIDIVQQAVKHLPSSELGPAQSHRLNAWLASRRGDVETERQEQQRLIEANPTDLAALDRLVQLAEKEGQHTKAAELGRKKAETDRLQARYDKLYERNQPIRDAVEMARLAEHLGRWFEARVFLVLAISEDPDREDLTRDFERLSRGMVQQRVTLPAYQPEA
jgi:enediyne biosynthesis protein E4